MSLPKPAREERPITVDQTNLSVVVGERVVVKWMRSPGGDRSPRLLAHPARFLPRWRCAPMGVLSPGTSETNSDLVRAEAEPPGGPAEPNRCGRSSSR
jgi:hypothetical protein